MKFILSRKYVDTSIIREITVPFIVVIFIFIIIFLWKKNDFAVIGFYYTLFFYVYTCRLICMSLKFKAAALTLVHGGICDVLWIELKSFELI